MLIPFKTPPLPVREVVGTDIDIDRCISKARRGGGGGGFRSKVIGASMNWGRGCL